MIGQADLEALEKQEDETIQQICNRIRELSKHMFLFRICLLNQIRKETSRQLTELKQYNNFQTYDDLQKQMIKALNVKGSDLAGGLRKQFKAAIIDEFQDTDQGQYEIFSKVFAPGLKEGNPVPGTLFFVGDPKQAIYAFRGGDIFTYKEAASDVGKQNTLSLNRNFRSADSLVTAVNEIFANHNLPFADPSIKFTPVESCGKKTLQFNGEQDLKPFHYLSGGKSKKTLFAACAEKICQLLTFDVKMPDPDSKGEEVFIPVKPSDIAILCRSKNDLSALTEQLQLKGIPYITAAPINIYDSQEARDLEKLFLAIQNPTDLKTVTWLMQTSLLREKDCRSLCEKDNASEREAAVIQTQEILTELKTVFEQKGVAELFRNFMNAFEIHKRYPGLPQGQQKYSNLIQLRDILTAEESKGNKSPEILTIWLQKQLSPQTRTDLETEVILPTDAPAVKIMTIHNSKGLQFPIVFLPDLAFAEISVEKTMKYHDPENNNIYHRLTTGNSLNLALGEALQEELRIAYVALTRASRANYLLILEKSNMFNAIHWLYTAKDIPPETPTENLNTIYAPKERMKLFSAIGKENIEVIESTDTVYTAQFNSELKLMEWGNPEIAEPAPKISYTSAHKFFRRNDLYSRSEEEITGELSADEKRKKKENLLPVFSLPKGDLFGTACHTIMEKWDFKDEEKLNELISRYLSVVNIKGKEEIAAQMFRNAVTAPIPQEDGSMFSLQEIISGNRCSEMDFDFILNRNFNPGELGAILNRYYRDRLKKEKIDLLYAIRNQTGDVTSYTGSADLVFCYNGKFYIVDWKTDILDETPESFGQERLFGVMWQKFYLYQSLLYSSALIRFLSMRLDMEPEDVYNQYFGGVRYLFLRGMNPAAPGRGIYADKPDFELICKIAEVK